MAAAVADGLLVPRRDEEIAILLLCWMFGRGVVGGVEEARVCMTGFGLPVGGTVAVPLEAWDGVWTAGDDACDDACEGVARLARW